MKIQRVLLTGGNGFIGSNFLRYISQKSVNIDIFAPTHRQMSIENNRQLEEVYNNFRPDVVIHCAAHRNASTAELQRGDKKGSAWQTNVVGTSHLAQLSQKQGTFIIYISTDMVFSGNADNPGPYTEDHKSETDENLLSWYGWTKALGEKIIKENRKSAIIRIGNVTEPIHDPKLDYISKILYLFERDQLYPLFSDQWLTLTYIPALLHAIENVMNNQISGVFHIGSNNRFTPYLLGMYLLEKRYRKSVRLDAVSIGEYLKVNRNRYPHFGGLSCIKTGEQLGIELMSWQDIVDRFLYRLMRE